MKDTLRHRWLVIRCAAIGSLVGALPGLGGTVVDWIAYGHAMQSCKNTESFGSGDIRGVLAPEAANNAKEGGALIPTLLFGIPGSGSMALLLGGLVLIGIEPGPEMADTSLDITFMVIWSIALANILGAGICLTLSHPIARLTTIRYTLIAPFMLAVVFFAAFQASQDWGDLFGLLLCGTLGIFMKRFGWSRPALLIGFVLSDKVEAAFYQTLQVYGFSFLDRPIVLFLLLATVASVVVAMRGRRQPSSALTQTMAQRPRAAQFAFLALMLLFTITMFVDASSLRYLGGFYPKVTASITFALLLMTGFHLLPGRQPNVVPYDEESFATGQAPAHGNGHYLAWLAALLAGSAIIGFVLAVALFVFLFLRTKAATSLLAATIGATAIVALFALLGWGLTLEFPHGLLQEYVSLP